MCTAFVNGIEDTQKSATTPCTHQVAKRASSAAASSKPSPMKPWPRSQPKGAQTSKSGSSAAMRNASRRKPVRARKKRLPRNAQSPMR
jgi:hypothetical protein